MEMAVVPPPTGGPARGPQGDATDAILLRSRDRRTVAKAMRDVAADGQVHGRPAWRVTTALEALRRREGKATDSSAAYDECERIAADLEAGLKRLRGENRPQMSDCGAE